MDSEQQGSRDVAQLLAALHKPPITEVMVGAVIAHTTTNFEAYIARRDELERRPLYFADGVRVVMAITRDERDRLIAAGAEHVVTAEARQRRRDRLCSRRSPRRTDP